MNKQNLSDTQSSRDHRGKPIELVGISDLSYPFCFEDDGIKKEISGNFKMGVYLPSDQKGTHMSRFIEVLNEHQQTHWTLDNFDQLAKKISELLESEKSRFQVDFTWFIKKYAPVSQVMSLLDYQISLIAREDSSKQNGKQNSTRKQIKVTVPVKSLCPCSKSISNYGAHNQRSYVSVWIEPISHSSSALDLNLKEIAQMVEKNSSSELYPILKRVDEKYITEYAYDHALFVEDTIRDVALALENNSAVKEYQVYSENIESIHNHSAFAMLQSSGFKAL